MPHTPYPLLANYWTPQAPVAKPNPPVGPAALLNIPCSLVPIRFFSVFNNLTLPTPRQRIVYMSVSTPVTFDTTLANLGYLELPAGSGTFWAVIDVNDYGKGTGLAERALTISMQTIPNPMP